jgi:6-phosphogluconolactonase/glucosamine-6-phosphate isomerase/deaminase
MRMTMSAGLLKASRTTMVLVGGTEKLAALEAVLKGASFPLSLALGARTAFYYLE